MQIKAAGRGATTAEAGVTSAETAPAQGRLKDKEEAYEVVREATAITMVTREVREVKEDMEARRVTRAAQEEVKGDTTEATREVKQGTKDGTKEEVAKEVRQEVKQARDSFPTVREPVTSAAARAT